MKPEELSTWMQNGKKISEPPNAEVVASEEKKEAQNVPEPREGLTLWEQLKPEVRKVKGWFSFWQFLNEHLIDGSLVNCEGEQGIFFKHEECASSELLLCHLKLKRVCGCEESVFT